ncbi:MAG: hypothetical protein AB8B94_05660 [Hyphomicrobiales bacterium]
MGKSKRQKEGQYVPIVDPAILAILLLVLRTALSRDAVIVSLRSENLL